jgi:cysteine synthase B
MILTRDHNRIQLKQRLQAIRQRIGQTRLHTFRQLYPHGGVSIKAKLEWEQLGGSIKARPALRIMEAAIDSGQLHPEKVLLAAGSGNLGIAYATIGKELGIGVTLCISEQTSAARKEMLLSLGANIVTTTLEAGIDSAHHTAKELAQEYPNLYYFADAGQNDNNWLAHYFGTAEELFRQAPDMTHFVAGLGTGGTFAGISRRIKDSKPCIQTISLHPESATQAPEGWQQLNSSRIPRLYDPALADDRLIVSLEETLDLMQRVYETEGLQISPSAAANLAGAIKVANRLKQGTVVTVLADQADEHTNQLP